MDYTVPKYTKSTFELKANYFVVEQGGQYHYFPVKIDPDTAEREVMRMVTRPPLLLQGHVIFGRKVYEVSVSDTLRGIVRKSSLVLQGRANGNTRGASATRDPSAPTNPDLRTSTDSSADTDEHGISRDAGLEIEQAADLAWQEQTRSLLEALHQEEGGEWEIADTPQS